MFDVADALGTSLRDGTAAAESSGVAVFSGGVRSVYVCGEEGDIPPVLSDSHCVLVLDGEGGGVHLLTGTVFSDALDGVEYLFSAAGVFASSSDLVRVRSLTRYGKRYRSGVVHEWDRLDCDVGVVCAWCSELVRPPATARRKSRPDGCDCSGERRSFPESPLLTLGSRLDVRRESGSAGPHLCVVMPGDPRDVSCDW